MMAAAEGKRCRRGVAIARGHVGERLPGVRGIERIGKQHVIVDGAAQVDAEAAENVERQLVVVDALGDGGVFEKRAQLGSERKAQADAGIGADADVGGGFLLGGFDDIEKREASLRFGLGLRVRLRRRHGGAASRAKAKPFSRAAA